MRIIKTLFVLFLMTSVTISCKKGNNPEIKTVETEINDEITTSELDPDATYAKAEFTIEGMTCAMGCAKTIEKKLAKMEGVKSAQVDFDKKLAMVEFDDSKVTTTSLEETVKKAGESYSVKEMKTVETFAAKKGCSADCKKACCSGQDKSQGPDSKTEASNSVEGSKGKMGCSAACKKACCAEKAKA